MYAVDNLGGSAAFVLTRLNPSAELTFVMLNPVSS